jgi:penicillin-binding protein 1A
MVGGRDYGASSFNRAVQARRQPGSTFKLFVYLAALRAGLHPDTVRDDTRFDFAGWSPRNDDNRYLGPITLQRAFARSSNVVAARLTQEVGVKAVIRAARDLGLTTPLPNEATITLGSSGVSLLELTAAYAAIADGRYPVKGRGLEDEPDRPWYSRLANRRTEIPERERDEMLALLGSSLRGTGREATLSVGAFGKTGTSQGGRDGWFIGWAQDLVVGVWVGNDDNSPNPGLHGGGIPAQIWRDYMQSALGIAPVVREEAAEAVDANAQDDAVGNLIEGVLPDVTDALEAAGARIQTELNGVPLDEVPETSPRDRDRERGPDRPPPDEEEEWR